MPIEVKELLIEVNVTNTADATSAAPVTANKELIAECIDQIMTVINTSKER